MAAVTRMFVPVMSIALAVAATVCAPIANAGCSPATTKS